MTFICPMCRKPNPEFHLHRFAIELEHMHQLPRRYDVYYHAHQIGAVQRVQHGTTLSKYGWVAIDRYGVRLEPVYDQRREAVARLDFIRPKRSQARGMTKPSKR